MVCGSVREGKDAEFIVTVRRHRAEGLGWRYDGLSDWSTDAIFAKLRELSIDSDMPRHSGFGKSIRLSKSILA